MKVIDQTVREIKREVNLKVLKVPEIEQKVLDATDNEPWGPHGSALAEIAQATKKFTECQMVMNVLWARLSETGKDWRHVYKALAVVEYLVSHGSERAVDDIVEHTFQISSLSSFEYVEPSGKDNGINVRKKVENIVALLNDKDKIQEVRNKAAANRDKYFGLSSTGITYKSGAATSGISSSSFQSTDRYGGLSSTKEGDLFKDSYKDRDQFGEGKKSTKSRRGSTSETQGSTLKKGSMRHGSKDQDILPSARINDSDKYGSLPPQSSSVPSTNYDDDFDDFDPRGTLTTKSSVGSSNQMDLFGDLMDAPTSVPMEVTSVNRNSAEADLFADATFVSAPPNTQVDLFASQSAASSSIDFFAAPDPVVQAETKSPPKLEPTNTNTIDPFAAVPLNNFDGSDLFGGFTSHTDPVSQEAAQNPINDFNGKSSVESKPMPKKDAFQVKSGIWADTLSRGLIDLNISAPKKVSLADIGVVGGLSDGLEEKEKRPPTSIYMGRAMGPASGKTSTTTTGFPTSTAAGGDDFFSSLGSQQYQFGGFQK